MDAHPLQYGRLDSFPSDNSQAVKPVKPVKLPKSCQVATWLSSFKLLDLSDLLVVFAQIVWPQCCKDLAAVDLPLQQLRWLGDGRSSLRKPFVSATQSLSY